MHVNDSPALMKVMQAMQYRAAGYFSVAAKICEAGSWIFFPVVSNFNICKNGSLRTTKIR